MPKNGIGALLLYRIAHRAGWSGSRQGRDHASVRPLQRGRIAGVIPHRRAEPPVQRRRHVRAGAGVHGHRRPGRKRERRECVDVDRLVRDGAALHLDRRGAGSGRVRLAMCPDRGYRCNSDECGIGKWKKDELIRDDSYRISTFENHSVWRIHSYISHPILVMLRWDIPIIIRNPKDGFRGFERTFP